MQLIEQNMTILYFGNDPSGINAVGEFENMKATTSGYMVNITQNNNNPLYKYYNYFRFRRRSAGRAADDILQRLKAYKIECNILTRTMRSYTLEGIIYFALKEILGI